MSEQEFREQVVGKLGGIEAKLDGIDTRLTRVENKLFNGNGNNFAEKISQGLLEVVKLSVAGIMGFIGGQIK